MARPSSSASRDGEHRTSKLGLFFVSTPQNKGELITSILDRMHTDQGSATKGSQGASDVQEFIKHVLDIVI